MLQLEYTSLPLSPQAWKGSWTWTVKCLSRGFVLIFTNWHVYLWSSTIKEGARTRFPLPFSPGPLPPEEFMEVPLAESSGIDKEKIQPRILAAKPWLKWYRSPAYGQTRQEKWGDLTRTWNFLRPHKLQAGWFSKFQRQPEALLGFILLNPSPVMDG